MAFSKTNDPTEVFVQSAFVSEERLDEPEAIRRYEAGWIVGGYTHPIQAAILRQGGLWLRRHRVWTMPDRDSWILIRSLLPGDF